MATASSSMPPRVRDPRLDFYRGIAMLIIFTSHTPGNFWGDWIPGRFGFSDATEIFVFCSGMASAIAFGGSYDRRGWVLGTARVLFRCWQVYWAHICLFFALAFMLIALDSFGFEKNYVNSLNLGQFFNGTKDHLFGLLTLTYVPNYFDILPMYIAILLMMPIVMGLASVHVGLAFAFCAALWFIAQTRIMMMLGIEQFAVSLPASLTSDRPWFFNPFAWQLVFFTGFALVRGWIPRPPVNVVLVTIAAIIVLGMMTLSHVAIREWGFSWAGDWRRANPHLVTKTDFGLARYTHFLALAYLAYAVAGDGGRRLIVTGRNVFARIGERLIALLTKVGQQSLAVFIVSMMLSIFVGAILTETGTTADDVTAFKSHTMVAAGNILGWAFLVFIAYTAAWFKSQPWRKSATG
ncbi:OpgC domain-containing protein [Loktanella sp. F6476L]|uniref:OpgC family protein n=1 Tax=Loktanella sp. F6476L TaxID=2926405 RepID=UPI001FF32662|nr:OpgC domain-containing protein [Loktanella sp. F6476L]MCK0120516.1 OpgC domain-containing protein [Loktanella sp. F6476L]